MVGLQGLVAGEDGLATVAGCQGPVQAHFWLECFAAAVCACKQAVLARLCVLR